MQFMKRWYRSAIAAVGIAACSEEPSGLHSGLPAAYLVVSGDNQTATVGTELPAPIVVRVVDSDSNPVAGQIVNFHVVSGGGGVFAGASLTNAAGEARERWTLGTVVADSQKVEVRAVDATTGEPKVYAVFRASATAAAPAALRKVAGDGGTTTASTPVASRPRVRVVDQYENSVAGATVSFAVASGGGSVTGESQVSAADGLAEVGSWTLGDPPGSNTLTASVTGTSVSSVTFTAIGVAPGYAVTASSLVFEVGTSVTVTAQLMNSSGAPLARAGRTVTWSRIGANGIFSSATSVTNAEGSATVSFTSDTVFTTGSLDIVASDAFGSSGIVNASVVRAPPAGLRFVQQPVNTGFMIAVPDVTVRVLDRYNNALTTNGIQITLAIGANPGGATLAGTTTQATVSGVATFSELTLDQPSSGYTLQATSVGLTSSTSNGFAVSPVGVVFTTTRTLRSVTASGIHVHAASTEVLSTAIVLRCGASERLVSVSR
jgi:hypothetical protein